MRRQLKLPEKIPRSDGVNPLANGWPALPLFADVQVFAALNASLPG